MAELLVQILIVINIELCIFGYSWFCVAKQTFTKFESGARDHPLLTPHHPLRLRRLDTSPVALCHSGPPHFLEFWLLLWEAIISYSKRDSKVMTTP